MSILFQFVILGNHSAGMAQTIIYHSIQKRSTVAHACTRGPCWWRYVCTYVHGCSRDEQLACNISHARRPHWPKMRNFARTNLLLVRSYARTGTPTHRNRNEPVIGQNVCLVNAPPGSVLNFVGSMSLRRRERNALSEEAGHVLRSKYTHM